MKSHASSVKHRAPNRVCRLPNAFYVWSKGQKERPKIYRSWSWTLACSPLFRRSLLLSQARHHHHRHQSGIPLKNASPTQRNLAPNPLPHSRRRRSIHSKNPLAIPSSGLLPIESLRRTILLHCHSTALQIVPTNYITYL